MIVFAKAAGASAGVVHAKTANARNVAVVIPTPKTMKTKIKKKARTSPKAKTAATERLSNSHKECYCSTRYGYYPKCGNQVNYL